MPITIRASDNVIMTVDEPVIVNYMINRTDPTLDGIYIAHLRSETLFKVIKYLQFHAQSNSPGDMEVFDKEFVNEEQNVLFEIFVAAFAFKIKGLKDLTRPSVQSFAAKLVAESSQHRTTIGFQGYSSIAIGFQCNSSKRSTADERLKWIQKREMQNRWIEPFASQNNLGGPSKRVEYFDFTQGASL
ncbi:hypothetical protein OROMI_033493 [Orobanche minor]